MMKIFVALGILLSICFRVCDSFEFLKPMQIGSRLRSKAQPQVQQLQAMQVTAPPRKKAQNETRRPGVAYGANKPPSDAPVSRPSAFATNLLTLLEAESVGTLMPKEELVAILVELRKNDIIMEKIHNRFSHVWKYFHFLVYNEKRSLKEILGEDLTLKVLNVAEKLDIYDHRTVKSFVKTPAFSNVVSGVVYESMFDVGRKIDVLGGVVNSIPVVGPIRQGIGRGIKKGLDKTLGVRFKKSLSPVVNEESMQKVAKFMSSQKNKQTFEQMNRNIVENIISRPLCSIFPDSTGDEMDKLRVAVWNIIIEAPPAELYPWLSVLYDNISLTKLSDIIQIDTSITTSPSTGVSSGNSGGSRRSPKQQRGSQSVLSDGGSGADGKQEKKTSFNVSIRI